MADRRVRLILEAQVDNFNSNLRRAQTEADGLSNKLRTALGSREMQTLGRHLTAFGVVTTAALGAAAKSAMDWETSWTDVMRRTEGTPEQLSALEDGLRGLAREMPATHAEIAEVAASAAQLGVSVNDVEAFTEVMVMMGATTDMTAEQAATSMARFANVMGTSTDDMDRLGSAIVDLGNNSATTESEITTMAQRMAAAGTQVGMTEGDVLGIAAALSSVGVEAAAGGTAVSRTIYDINGAVSEGGDALEGFAEIAGLSIDEFSRLWQDDAAMGMEAFVSGLARIDEEGGNAQGALAEIGITEVRTTAALLSMAQAGDFLTDSIERGNRAFDDNTAMSREYAYIQETLAAQIQMFWSRVQDAAIDIGETVLPVMESLVNWASEAITWFSELPAPVRNTAVGLTALAGALGLAVGSAILLAPSLLASRDALSMIAPAGGTARRSVGLLTRGLGLLTGAFIAGQAAGALFNQELQVGDVDGFRSALGNLNSETEAAAARLDVLATSQLGVGGQLEGLEHAFDVFQTGGFERALKSPLGAMGFLNDELDASQEAFKSMDGAMAGFIADGNLQSAADSFLYLSEFADRAGWTITEFQNAFPGLEAELYKAGISMDEFSVATGLSKTVWDDATGTYVNADVTLSELRNRLSDAGNEALDAAFATDDLESAMAELGEEALSASEAMRQLTEEMMEAGVIGRDARAAARDYEDALDALTASVKENGTTLDTTTEAGRRNEAALDAIADAGHRSMLAMADNGASQDELQDKLIRTRDDLFAAAQQFTNTDDEARELTRSIMGVPDGVTIDSWMSDEAKRIADATNDSLDRINGRLTTSNHIHTTTEIRRLQLDGNGRRGAIPGYASGGRMGDGWKIVGEEGPELIHTGPGWVNTAAETKQLLDAQRNSTPSGSDLRSVAGSSMRDMPSGRDMIPTYAAGRMAGGGGSAPIDYDRLADAVSSRGMTGTLYTERGAMLGEVKMAVKDPGVIHSVSTGLQDRARRDSRGGRR